MGGHQTPTGSWWSTLKRSKMGLKRPKTMIFLFFFHSKVALHHRFYLIWLRLLFKCWKTPKTQSQVSVLWLDQQNPVNSCMLNVNCDFDNFMHTNYSYHKSLILSFVVPIIANNENLHISHQSYQQEFSKFC